MPLFTVLVPVYNHEKYIGAALDSLLAQTDPDWEAIVVDDGSTDGTPAVLEKYERRDARFRVFHKPNGGVSTALNHGIRAARGDWVLWLSSDDWFASEKLAIHRTYAARHPDCRFFFTQAGNYEETEGRRTKSWVDHVWQSPWQVLGQLEYNFIVTVSVAMHQEALTHVGGFDERLRMAQDYRMWLRLMAWRPAVYIETDTCTERQHGLQYTVRQRPVLFYDSAIAGIELLNDVRFEGLTQGADLADGDVAVAMLDRAMDVAGNPHSFVYALGPHHGLILRTMEWVWGARDLRVRRQLQRHFGRRARAFAWTHRGSRLGFIWKMAAAAEELGVQTMAYSPVDWRWLIRQQHCRWLADGDERAESVAHYAERFGIALGVLDRQMFPPRRSFLFTSDSVPNEIVKQLAERGHSVARARTGSAEFGIEDGVCRLQGRRLDLFLALAGNPQVDVHVSDGANDPMCRLPAGRLRCAATALALTANVLETLPIDTNLWRDGVARAIVRRWAQARRTLRQRLITTGM